jgi:hypothetical protein
VDADSRAQDAGMDLYRVGDAFPYDQDRDTSVSCREAGPQWGRVMRLTHPFKFEFTQGTAPPRVVKRRGTVPPAKAQTVRVVLLARALVLALTGMAGSTLVSAVARA